ncbi:MAG TPA: SIS domain-containing protein [Steroidobacteraceae bacterium]
MALLKKTGGGEGLDPEISHFLEREAEEHRLAFDALMSALAEPFAATLELWHGALRAGGKLLVFGNGGSAGNAQHIAAELVVRYEKNRAAMAAIALSADSLIMTAATNDFGFETVFSRQVAALGRPGDVAVGLSTSGRSPNVLAALREARSLGLHTSGLIGADGGPMHALCDTAIIVPSRITGRIQEMHLLVTHMLCKALEARLDTAGKGA